VTGYLQICIIIKHKIIMNALTNQYAIFFEQQENNRALWNGFSLMIQANILTPLTLVSMNAYHGGDWQLAACVLCFFSVLIPILSAQPVKIGVTIFWISALVHSFIIGLNVLS